MKNNREYRLILKRIKKMNNFLVLNALVIVALSISTIYSATISKNGNFYEKEAMWAGLSLVAYIFFSLVDYKKYLKYYKVLYVFNILFLASVLVIGDSRLGAQRWITLGPISLQPSELGKVIVVITLAAFLSTYFREKTLGFKNLVISGIYIAPILALILKQPDLGTTLIIIFTFFIMLFMCNLEWKTIILMGIGAAGFVPFAYFFLLKGYQRTRVLTFLNPESDPLKSGWNVTQSMIAIGSGGFYGKGFLNSTQSKLKFLPEAHTDFIVSVFLEERGFLGGLLLFILYVALIMQIFYIADTTEDKFGKLICYGIGSIFFFHFAVNVGMTMGIMPVTGKPLLLMSYGGTSLLISFMMLGIVQSIRIYRE